ARTAPFVALLGDGRVGAPARPVRLAHWSDPLPSPACDGRAGPDGIVGHFFGRCRPEMVKPTRRLHRMRLLARVHSHVSGCRPTPCRVYPRDAHPGLATEIRPHETFPSIRHRPRHELPRAGAGPAGAAAGRPVAD